MSANLRFEGEDGVTVLVVPDRDEFGDPKSVAHVLDRETALRLHAELTATLGPGPDATVCETCRGNESLEGFPQPECPACKGQGLTAAPVQQGSALAAISEDAFAQAYKNGCDSWPRQNLRLQTMAGWRGVRTMVASVLGNSESVARLASAASGILALMDSIPIDSDLGDETDRVFPRYEFEPLRQALSLLGTQPRKAGA